MASYQDQLDAADAREVAETKRKREARQRYESAAKEAHKTRCTARLLLPNSHVPTWDEMSLSSQRHLIADAENVALNPSITTGELARLYRERLVASGGLDHPDLEGEDEVIESLVLDRLKKCLDGFNPVNG